MAIQALFFDLDNTLYDRSLPFQEAFQRFFGSLANRYDAAALYRVVAVRSEESFQAVQRGEMSMRDMYIYRFKRAFEDFGISITEDDALLFQSFYKECQQHISLRAETIQFLDACKARKYRTGIISNGPGAHQRDKITALQLSHWIDPELIVISGEFGKAKPDPSIFRYAQSLIGCDAGELVYIGDSRENDLIPAQTLGWNAYLYNQTPADWSRIASELGIL